MSQPVLLTMSGRIPPDLDAQVDAGERPRADYRVMSELFGADVIDVEGALAATGRFGSLLNRVAGAGPLLGWYCFRRRRDYEVIVTDGEQAGLPFALLCRILGRKSARHLMIVHILSTPTKTALIRYARLAGLIDRYLVYCSWQRDFLRREFAVPPERILLSTFMVDSSFFDPALVDAVDEPMICSAGLERRDYATLIEAVEGMDVRVVVAAASPWSTRADSTSDRALPANMEVRRLNLFDLRKLYAAARFVVMPLEDVEFQAGITTILEAMSMERPVICTRTPGQTDTIIDGRTGVYVDLADVAALRTAIQRFLDDEVAVASMGSRAREWVLDNADIDLYARRVAAEVEALRNQTAL